MAKGGSDRHRLPGAQVLRDLDIVGRTGEAHEHDDHAHVHDVAAPPLTIPSYQVQEGDEVILLLDPGPRPRSLDELHHDDRQNEGTDGEGEKRPGVPDAHREEHRPNNRPESKRKEEVAPQVARTCLAPGDDRADPHQGQENQPDRDVHPIEEDRTHCHLRTRQPLRQEREHRPPGDRERDPEEDQIIHQKGRFPRNEGLELPVAVHERKTPENQHERHCAGHPQEAQEDPGNRQVLGEGVHGFDQPRPRQEGREDRHEEGEHHQPHVPHFQHPPILLNHHGVEEGGGHQPGEKGGILNRVPEPVTTPAELLVGPAHPEDDPEGEEEPAREDPLSGDLEPPRVKPPGDEGRKGEGERNREGGEPEVQRRGVDRHPVVLELRVQPAAIAGGEAELLERGGDKYGDPDEECDHCQEDTVHIRHQLAVAPSIDPDSQNGEEGEVECPEDEGSALARPQPGNLEPGGKVAAGVIVDVPVLEPILQKRGDDPGGRQKQKEEHSVGAAFSRKDQITARPPASEERQHAPPDGDGQGDPECELAQRRNHPEAPPAADDA